MTEGWEQAATSKRNAINALIPEAWRIASPPSREQQRDVSGEYVHGLLSPQEVTITETDAVEIARKIAVTEWSSADVTRAFCHRAAIVHQLTNCLLEIFFDAGIRQAELLDEYQRLHGKTIGPLHGVPVSLKDQIHVPGVETSMGYVGWLDTFQGVKGTGKERVFESEIAKELRQSGAVFYCKTSVPHTLMAPETINNIAGYCWSSRNRLLSSGGSSGGEGTLIAAHGSPLGFGTDIGGSIRIPAASNGVYGLRPSTGRVPYEGMANSFDGQNTVLSVVGPLASSLPSIRLVMQALLSREPWLDDPLVHEIPWRDDHYEAIPRLAQGTGDSGKLTFGIIRHDGSVAPHPPVRRAVEATVRALEQQGYEVVEWSPPAGMHQRLQSAAGKAYVYDGGKDAKDAFELSGEPMAKQVKMIYPEWKPEEKASHIAANNVWKRELQKEYLDYWNSTRTLTKSGRPVDAIISPVAHHAAAIPENYGYLGYTTWVNAVDYPAVVIPILHCDKTIDKADEKFEPVDERDQAMHKLYEPEIFDGSPVCLQIVGRRLQEEKTIALAEVVDAAVKKFT